MSYQLGFIGAGNMAEAIARGVVGSGLLKPTEILAADISPQRRDVFADRLKIRAIEEAAAVASQCPTVLLAVKPQQMAAVLAAIGEVARCEALIITIAAGISNGYIATAMGRRAAWRVVRAMPNTPMLVGKGMVAICPGQHATAADMEQTRRIFESAASVVELQEPMMDAVTAVSGSGPAYFFFLAEQMVRAGMELGLTAQQAHQLATRTALGAAEMMVSSIDSPQELRRKVTSPGGTTQAAIAHMEGQQLPQIVVDALKAAATRSRELGK
jgi:pyrroline-5-carboxylate reductase